MTRATSPVNTRIIFPTSTRELAERHPPRRSALIEWFLAFRRNALTRREPGEYGDPADYHWAIHFEEQQVAHQRFWDTD